MDPLLMQMLRLFGVSLLWLTMACGRAENSQLTSFEEPPLPPRGETPAIILFFAWPSMPLERCIQEKMFAQTPPNLPTASIHGPVGLMRDNNGEIVPHVAQAMVGDGTPRLPNDFYKVRFTTMDTDGWRVSRINWANGVYASTLQPTLQVLHLDDSPAFQVDISSCLQAPAA